MNTSRIDVTFHVRGEHEIRKLEAVFDPTNVGSTRATRWGEGTKRT